MTVRSLADAATVVVELHPHLTGAGFERRVAADEVVLDAEEVVAVRRPALVEVQAPATGDAALDDDRTVGATLGDLDLGGDRVGLVLERQDRTLRQTTHPAEQLLAVALDQLWTACEVRVEPFDQPIVEWQHVVLHGLDQPEPLQFVQPVGLLG